MLRRNFLTTFAAALAAAAVPTAVTKAVAAEKAKRSSLPLPQPVDRLFWEESLKRRIFMSELAAAEVAPVDRLEGSAAYNEFFNIALNRFWGHLHANYPRVARRGALTITTYSTEERLASGRLDFEIDGTMYFLRLVMEQGQMVVDGKWSHCDSGEIDSSGRCEGKLTVDLEMDLLFQEQLLQVFVVVADPCHGKPNLNGDVFMRAGEGVELTKLPDGMLRVQFGQPVPFDSEELRQKIRGIKSNLSKPWVVDEMAIMDQADLQRSMSLAKEFSKNLDFACVKLPKR